MKLSHVLELHKIRVYRSQNQLGGEVRFQDKIRNIFYERGQSGIICFIPGGRKLETVRF